MIGAAEFTVPSAAAEPSRELTVTTTPSRPRGRPRVDYDLDIAYQICDELGAGGVLSDICAKEDMPSAATVYRWLGEHSDFAWAYHCALMAKFDMRSEECIAIADDATKDYELVTAGDGAPTVQPKPELIARTKLRLGERHRQMAKELPRKYGEAKALEAPPEPPKGPPGKADGAKVINPAGSAAVPPPPNDEVRKAMLQYIEAERADK